MIHLYAPLKWVKEQFAKFQNKEWKLIARHVKSADSLTLDISKIEWSEMIVTIQFIPSGSVVRRLSIPLTILDVGAVDYQYNTGFDDGTSYGRFGITLKANGSAIRIDQIYAFGINVLDNTGETTWLQVKYR